MLLIFSSGNAEAFPSKGWQSSHVHVPTAGLLYSEAVLRGTGLRSASILFSHSVAFSRRDAVRFLLWWLFLHRRLRSRQRGPAFRSFPKNQVFAGRRRAPDRLIISVQASEVFIPRIRRPFGHLTHKPFGFGSERTRQRLSAPSAPERSRHHVRPTSRCRSKSP